MKIYYADGCGTCTCSLDKKKYLNVVREAHFLHKHCLLSGVSTYDFSTLYTTLPHNLIKEILTELIEQTFNREGSLFLACNDKNAFFVRTT